MGLEEGYMPKKAKLKCSFKAPGGKKAMLHMSTDAPGFGRMKCDIQYDLESDRMTEIVIARGQAAAERLDGIEVDGTDTESITEYVSACMQELAGLMEDVQAELTAA